MMGGLGSGRPSGGGRATVEMCRSIDVNRLRRDGALVSGFSGTMTWSRNGEKIASIGMRGGRDKIVLDYRWRQSGSEWQDVVEPIPIRWRPCRFGGDRPFFQCPGVVSGIACNRLAAKLYCASRYYLCRRCYRLSYASRSEDACDRALRRANRIRTRLGGEPGLASAFPRRPKGMWRRTYDRLMREVFETEDRADDKMAIVVARLLDFERKHESGQRKQKGYW